MTNGMISLERLVMPDDLYKKEREKLNIEVGYDYTTIRDRLCVLSICIEKPFESATTINYIKINRFNPKMLDYEHYCMTIKESLRLNQVDFNILCEVINNE